MWVSVSHQTTVPVNSATKFICGSKSLLDPHGGDLPSCPAMKIPVVASVTQSMAHPLAMVPSLGTSMQYVLMHGCQINSSQNIKRSFI